MEPAGDGKSNFAKELYGESLQLSKPESSLGLSNLENEDGSFYGSSDEEPSEAYSMNKDTENMREKFHMLGYRDGISAGQEAAAQEGYNVGYKESVLAGYKFGIVRGVSSALAFLPDDLREKLIDEQETRDKFRKLHGSVHDLSTEAALKLFYGALTTKQGEEKSGEKEPCSSLCPGSGCVSGAFALFQLQEDMKKQLNGEVNYTEEELEKYIQSYKKVMVDSLWKLNVANIEATFFHVCQLVLQDPDSKREELRARARGLKISTNAAYIRNWPEARSRSRAIICNLPIFSFSPKSKIDFNGENGSLVVREVTQTSSFASSVLVNNSLPLYLFPLLSLYNARMPQYRQSGNDRFSVRGGGGSASDHVAIGIRNGAGGHGKANRWKRSVRPERIRRVGVGSVVFVLCLVLVVTVVAYYYISGFANNGYDDKGLDSLDGDFLTNVTRIDPGKVLEFGQGSVVHGRDSRYWDKDDRRRDDDYNEDEVEHKPVDVIQVKKGLDLKGIGLYNEAGRNELNKYEAEYQASLFKRGPGDHEAVHMDPDDDDAIDSHDSQADDEYVGHDEDDNDNEEPRKEKPTEVLLSMSKEHDDGDTSKRSLGESSLVTKVGKSGKTSRSATKRRARGRRSSGGACQMKLLNSSQPIVEPLNTRKSARFSLHYVENEEKPDGEQLWDPRFAGHQSLQEREDSFLAEDKKIHCGFVKAPKGSPTTGFDLTEDDTNYISRCHIAVISCIFGNSDRLRPPANKMADGLTRFNASDPFKLLPSNVPEGSFIVRAHTPMSNLFSCLWFNEVERFTPRDQLSFAYTYQKLRRMNPDKPFNLHMFKDCERRKIAKLFRHRSEEKRNLIQSALQQ
ncbi:hypothetical protein F2Q70_00038725 [Brassica cretica]|uniref:Essential protein Yae1 N-terminal domain-containing protein n=2 Tax=Brassica cretica TaxID=69181 RepID=A0A8S9K2U9_BRACR|nr:hypothetical protein F2Q70_00038725 [Brassica cretica]